MLGRLPWFALERRRRALRFLVFFDMATQPTVPSRHFTRRTRERGRRQVPRRRRPGAREPPGPRSSKIVAESISTQPGVDGLRFVGNRRPHRVRLGAGHPIVMHGRVAGFPIHLSLISATRVINSLYKRSRTGCRYIRTKAYGMGQMLSSRRGSGVRGGSALAINITDCPQPNATSAGIVLRLVVIHARRPFIRVWSR
jgi:hypothetical protein